MGERVRRSRVATACAACALVALATLALLDWGGNAALPRAVSEEMLMKAQHHPAAKPCRLVHAKALEREGVRGEANNGVCRCDAEYCDEVEPEGWSDVDEDTAIFYQSHDEGMRSLHLERYTTRIDAKELHRPERDFKVTCTRRQEMRGFGGAFTDAAAKHYKDMEPAVREHFVRSYFSAGASSSGPAHEAGGIGYSLGRVPLGGCDFSPGVYSYDDVPPTPPPTWDDARPARRRRLSGRHTQRAPPPPEGSTDFELRHFSVQVDEDSFKLQLIRDAIAAASPAAPSARAGRAAAGSAGSAHPARGGGHGAGPSGGAGSHGLRASNGSSGGSSSGESVPPAREQRPALFGSAWAPPQWMTAENSTLQCHLKDGYGASSKYAFTLARYYAKAVRAYAQHGVRLFGLTTSNEPHPIGQTWQQLSMEPEEQRQFIGYHLGPTLKPTVAAALSRSVKLRGERADPLSDPAVLTAIKESREKGEPEIIMLDDQRTEMKKWMDAVLTPGTSDVAAAPFVDGVGFHWYMSLEDALIVHPGHMLRNAHAEHPRPYLLGTEACEGFLPARKGPFLGQWWRAFKYCYDIMEDVNNWAAGWVDWNLMLDLRGGPNWKGNYVDSPVLFDAERRDAFYKQPMFYAMGHFSKFVPPGSRALLLEDWGRFELHASAFEREDGVVAVVVLNQRGVRRHYSIHTHDGRYINMYIPGHAMQTVLYRPRAGSCDAAR